MWNDPDTERIRIFRHTQVLKQHTEDIILHEKAAVFPLRPRFFPILFLSKNPIPKLIFTSFPMMEMPLKAHRIQRFQLMSR